MFGRRMLSNAIPQRPWRIYTSTRLVHFKSITLRLPRLLPPAAAAPSAAVPCCCCSLCCCSLCCCCCCNCCLCCPSFYCCRCPHTALAATAAAADYNYLFFRQCRRTGFGWRQTMRTTQNVFKWKIGFQCDAMPGNRQSCFATNLYQVRYPWNCSDPPPDELCMHTWFRYLLMFGFVSTHPSPTEPHRAPCSQRKLINSWRDTL